MKEYFLDNASTTKTYLQVAKVVYDTMVENYGNPSSTHRLGENARMVVENVRNQIAADINCNPHEIIFTSGACESNSLALYGTRKTELITSLLEHKSIEDAVCSGDFKNVTYVLCDEYGNINLESLEVALKDSNNPLVSIQYANSEIGTIQDILSISKLTRQYGGILHVDATQMYPEKQIDVKDMGIDLMSVSAQKFGGPKGIGFLYCRDGVEITSIIKGSQEDYRRGGTYNVPAIAGMGEALNITRMSQDFDYFYTSCARNEIANKLMKINGVRLNGPLIGENRLYNNISLIIDGIDAAQFVTLASMNGLYISAGSACSSGESTPSSTLKAIGLTDEEALSTIRITVNANFNDEDIDDIVDIFTMLIGQCRGA